MRAQVITWDQLKKKRTDPGTLIVDVRDRSEYVMGHYQGAVNIPYEEIGGSWQELKKYNNLIFYCDHGSRSLMAAKRLARMGLQTFSVLGGYETKRY